MGYRQLWVDDHIEMRNEASHRSNMDGPWQEKKRHDWDRFARIALDTTNLWNSYTTGATAATIAISEVQGGSVLITTGTADNDSCALSKPLIYSASKLAVVEFRIKISDVTGTGLFVGFSDAKYQLNNNIAIHYPDNVLATVAANAAGFVIDADHATSSIMCCSVIAGADTTPVDTAVDWADGETRTLRVEFDSTGRATFYMDEVAVASIASAVTAATLLCPTVQAITRANDGANTVYGYRYDAWQDE